MVTLCEFFVVVIVVGVIIIIIIIMDISKTRWWLA
jgi:hypothetical protein